MRSYNKSYENLKQCINNFLELNEILPKNKKWNYIKKEKLKKCKTF